LYCQTGFYILAGLELRAFSIYSKYKLYLYGLNNQYLHNLTGLLHARRRLEKLASKAIEENTRKYIAYDSLSPVKLKIKILSLYT